MWIGWRPWEHADRERSCWGNFTRRVACGYQGISSTPGRGWLTGLEMRGLGRVAPGSEEESSLLSAL